MWVCKTGCDHAKIFVCAPHAVSHTHTHTHTEVSFCLLTHAALTISPESSIQLSLSQVRFFSSLRVCTLLMLRMLAFVLILLISHWSLFSIFSLPRILFSYVPRKECAFQKGFWPHQDGESRGPRFGKRMLKSSSYSSHLFTLQISESMETFIFVNPLRSSQMSSIDLREPEWYQWNDIQLVQSI